VKTTQFHLARLRVSGAVLLNISKLKEYRSLLHNKLIHLVSKQDINDEREQIKTLIVGAARDVIQAQGKPPRNEWWDEECKKIIQEKREERKKWLQLKTRKSWNTYFNRRKQANKICIQKKKKQLKQ
jgi:hypothetical protein